MYLDFVLQNILFYSSYAPDLLLRPLYLFLTINLKQMPFFIVSHMFVRIPLNLWFRGVLGPSWLSWCQWNCSTCKKGDRIKPLSRNQVRLSNLFISTLKWKKLLLSKRTNSLSLNTLWFSRVFSNPVSPGNLMSLQLVTYAANWMCLFSMLSEILHSWDTQWLHLICMSSVHVF